MIPSSDIRGIKEVEMENLLFKGVAFGFDNEEVYANAGNDKDCSAKVINKINEKTWIRSLALTRTYTTYIRCYALSEEMLLTLLTWQEGLRRRTGNRIRVRAEDGQTFRSYCPHHHALATHRVVEDLGRVTEENRTAGHEECAVVQPNENDSSYTGSLIFGLGVFGGAYG